MTPKELKETLERFDLMVKEHTLNKRGITSMKVMTILGTRPEIIRLGRIIEKLDAHCTHILVHTGTEF